MKIITINWKILAINLLSFFLQSLSIILVYDEKRWCQMDWTKS